MHDDDRFQAINSYANSIIAAYLRAGEAAIPCIRNRANSGRMPGWSEYVQPVREKSLFWHKMWVKCGRPRSGIVADSMRCTRAAYHYAVKMIKKNEDEIICDRFAETILTNDHRNMWLEVERLRSKTSPVSSRRDTESISELFAAKCTLV